MEHYRSYFLNASSRIIGMTTFDSPDTQAALAEARRHLVDHECRVAAELWHDDAYVGWVMRSDAEKEDHRDADWLARCPLLLKAL